MEEIKDMFDDEEVRYVLTEHALLYEILKDYGIVVGEWNKTIWRHIYEDFMLGLEKAGYVSRGSNEGE